MKMQLTLFTILLISSFFFIKASSNLSVQDKNLNLEKNLNKKIVHDSTSSFVNEDDENAPINEDPLPPMRRAPDTPFPSLSELPKKKAPQRVTIVPDENALKNSKNIYYAFGTYKPPTQMWYFNKKIRLVDHDYSPKEIKEKTFFSHVVQLPMEMKELNVKFLFNAMLISNKNGGETADYYYMLKINDINVDSVYKAMDYSHEWYVSQTHELNGTLYNLPAGQHTITLVATSKSNRNHNRYTNYIHYDSYIDGIIGKTAKLSMVGYPSQ